MIKYPEKLELTVERERKFLSNINSSENSLMLVCYVEGEVAGNCDYLNQYIIMKELN